MSRYGSCCQRALSTSATFVATRKSSASATPASHGRRFRTMMLESQLSYVNQPALRLSVHDDRTRLFTKLLTKQSHELSEHLYFSRSIVSRHFSPQVFFGISQSIRTKMSTSRTRSDYLDAGRTRFCGNSLSDKYCDKIRSHSFTGSSSKPCQSSFSTPLKYRS